jgi:RNA recognition motif-containing protein
MNKKVFVGNLSFKLSETDLQDLFGQSGQVVSVTIPTDADTGRKRGFAFVEMGSEAEAEAAIQALNGQEVQGRAIAVSLSRPKENSRPRSGFGGVR